ncbi:MAG: ABC transporter ATP-binding protein [Burkholderiales bacterium]|nr:ABC transporter ATP-binding protein [Burkholderiales bacterium]
MGQAALVAAAEPPLVRVDGFVKRYGRRSAVAGVTLDIRHGEIYGLIGPDGAGKSSLMKAIAGVLSFDAGSVEVFGTSLVSEAAAELVKDRLGFMPQGLGLNLYAELSIEENIDFFARLRLVPAAALAERKERLLAITRLAQFRGRPMKHLSGGMKQKLALVCTLIHEPELIILDEPTTGVDPVSRRDFWLILSEILHERGATALVSTAYMDEASRFHRLALMFDGRVLAEGRPQELRRRVPGVSVQLRAGRQAEALARLSSRFAQVQALGAWIHVFAQDLDAAAADAEIRALLDDIPLDEMSSTEPELEDVFIASLHQKTAAPFADPASGQSFAAVRPAAADGAAIEARDLSRDFGDFRAVDSVSFSVRPGEIFGLLGANGAGKTTCIKMLTGIIPPTGGEGSVGGIDMRRAGRAIKQRIGYVSQAFSLYTDLTVVENVRLFAGIYGLTRRETEDRLAWTIANGGLAGYEDETAGSLPMGLRQRLALGCALVHRPQVLFLDEPTSGVDPVGRRQFWQILFHLSRVEGVAILITTHYMTEAEHCDRLALMYAGRIVADAAPAELKRRVAEEAGGLLEISASPVLPALALLRGSGFTDAALFGEHIHLLAADADAAGARLHQLLSQAGMTVGHIGRRPLSMEDVFVHYVTRLERGEAMQ